MGDDMGDVLAVLRQGGPFPPFALDPLEPGLGRRADGYAGRDRGVDSFLDVDLHGGGSGLGILLAAVGFGMALAARVVIVDDPRFATLAVLRGPGAFTDGHDRPPRTACRDRMRTSARRRACPTWAH